MNREYGGITADELKLFAGTGLRCVFDNREQVIESMWQGGRDDRFGVTFGGAKIGAWNIKPIVIPMSKITDSDAEWVEFVDDNSQACPTDEIRYADIRVFKVEIQKIRDGQLNYEEMCFLAKSHYDLFGWLDKKGADRMPLAIEKED